MAVHTDVGRQVSVLLLPLDCNILYQVADDMGSIVCNPIWYLHKVGLCFTALPQSLLLMTPEIDNFWLLCCCKLLAV